MKRFKTPTLDTVTNLAIILTCCIVAGDVIHKFSTHTRGNTAERQAQPSEYHRGDVIPAISGFPNLNSSALLLVVQSTCRYCHASIPFYQKIVDEVRQSKTEIRLIGVCLEPTEGCVAYFGSKNVDVDLALGVDPSALRVSGTPTLLLVNKSRRVDAVWTGLLSSNAEQTVLREIRNKTIG